VKALAVSSPIDADADLQAVTAAWPQLPTAIRTEVVNIVAAFMNENSRQDCEAINAANVCVWTTIAVTWICRKHRERRWACRASR
jgi:hypothetical protein